MPMIQPTDHMELRRKEDQGVDVSTLHKGRNSMIVESGDRVYLAGKDEG